MSKWFLLIVTGSAGTIARYVLSSTINSAIGTRFPFGTLVVNLVGCFIMGFLVELNENKFHLAPEVKLFLLIGFLGAFTTFSSFIAETADLVQRGAFILAFGNVLCSVAAGFVLFSLGVWLGKFTF
jgi:CrcB protein